MDRILRAVGSDDLKQVVGFVYVACVLGFLFLPILYVVLIGAQGSIVRTVSDRTIQLAIYDSVVLSVTAGVIATILAILATRGYRQTSHRKLYLTFMAGPLFTSGSAHAMPLLVLANAVDAGPSFGLLLLAETVYVLPFAFFVLLVTVEGIPRTLLDGARDLGASDVAVFTDIEAPLARDGIISAFLVAFLLTFNEPVRANLLGGTFTPLSGYLYAEYSGSGFTQDVYTVNILFILVAVVVVTVLVLLNLWRSSVTVDRVQNE
ncbi:ABC transporter permease [Halobellus ordinarius]|uniref:ABC transporter permease n=1 Tax=Halobellus ordinarius TaxID=3075120 RepID=UPI0028804014|nr:ABC transporter permease subunit [Halobellus sp. ZY16]